MQLEQLKLEKIRRRGLEDFYFFAKVILGNKDMDLEPHQELCDVLTDNNTSQKLILLPRGSFKSSIANVAFSLWHIVKNPDIRILMVTGGFTNATKYLGQIKEYIEKNKLFISLYGNLKPNNIGKWKRDDITINKRTDLTIKEPTITANSILQTKTGMHYDLIILDDVVTEENSNTPDQLQKIIDRYRLILSLPDPGSSLIVIGTRYHYNDLYGHIIAEEPEYWDILVRKSIETDGKLYFPSRLTKEILSKLKKSQGASHFCTPKETPILMGDFTTKSIKNIKVGDEIIGFKLGGKTRLHKTIVEKVFTYEDSEVYDFTMESGNIVRCTKEHNWYNGRGIGDKTHFPYHQPKINRNLIRCFDCYYKPTKQDLLDWQYISGIIDGEGSCKHKTISIHQSRKVHPFICDRIEQVLKRLKIDFSIYNYPQKPGMVQYWLNGGRTLRHRLIQYGNPAKKHQILKYMYNTCIADRSVFKSSRDKIVNMSFSKKETVYALQTTSSNYVAWGYASSNSNQYQNEPIDSETALFRQEWIQCYDELPKNLRHFILTDAAASLKNTADYSVVMVIGVDEHSNIYVVDPWRDRVTLFDFINKIFEQVQRYNVHEEGTVTIETNAFQQAIKYMLCDEMEKRKFYFGLTEMKPDSTQSKSRRIQAMQPYFENRKVFLAKHHDDLVEEITRFPKTRYDDMVDALSDFVSVIFPADKLIKDPYADKGLTANERKVWESADRQIRRVIRKKNWDKV